MRSDDSVFGKATRMAGLLLGVWFFFVSIGFLIPAGQAQVPNPGWDQLQAQTANLSFESLGGCASEFYLVSADGARSELADRPLAELDFSELRVDAVRFEFQPTSGCRVLLDFALN